MLVRREAARFALSSHGGMQPRNRTQRLSPRFMACFLEIPGFSPCSLDRGASLGMQGLKIAAALFRLGRARFLKNHKAKA